MYAASVQGVWDGAKSAAAKASVRARRWSRVMTTRRFRCGWVGGWVSVGGCVCVRACVHVSVCGCMFVTRRYSLAAGALVAAPAQGK